MERIQSNSLCGKVSGDSILKRVAAGDQSAVKDCIDTYGGLVWTIARKLNSNFEDSEDLAQEIFLSIWQNAHRFDERIASEAAFVAMIARRRVVDRIRVAYSRPQTTPLLRQEFAATTRDISIEETIDATKAVSYLRVLRAEQRELIWLSIVKGMSHLEISQSLKMPLGTVKTHIRRGLSTIRDRIQSKVDQAQHASVR